MKTTRCLVAVGTLVPTTLLLLGMLAACADDEAGEHSDPDASILTPVEAGATDAEVDASVEAAPCDDCQYFPSTCTDDALCATGPFDSSTSGGGIDPRTQINVIRGRGPNDVWVAGALGALAHFDGASWTRSDLGSERTLKALWLRDGSEVSFGTLDRLFTRGIAVADLDAGAPSLGGWTARTIATAPEDFFPASSRFMSAWAAPGAEWLWCAVTALQPGLTSGLWRLRVSPETSELEVGGLPPGLCRQLPCSQLAGIHGNSADELWAVGANGAAIRIEGAQSDSPTIRAWNTQTWNALRAVWAASTSEAWAVGAAGTVRHYAGDSVSWEIVSDVPTTMDLNGVWGSSPSDVWAVGDGAVVIHFDGTRWSRVNVAALGVRRPKLTTVWVPEPGHVWIGGEGIVLSLGGKP